MTSSAQSGGINMDADRGDHTGQAPLPGFGEPGRGGGQVPLPGAGEPGRGDSIRHIRRMSNWTLAALIVGTAGATVALAHNAVPSSTAAAGTTATTAGAGTTTATQGGPQVRHSVATTSGSHVVVTTTTRTANGKVIVTQVRRPTYHDN
jgi:hypothetical protein